MEIKIDPRYPDISYLRQKAQRRIPRFAWEYLEGGCNHEVNLHRNTADIREVQLKPYYLRDYPGANLETELFGQHYSAPFGICPIGLQGLMWPGASEILADAAFQYKLPYILSTVGTASIEKIGEITQGRAWFQLYHPAEGSLCNDLLDRAAASGYPVLVMLSDVPTFGYRPREIKNGLSIPPKMSWRNMMQILGSPIWAYHTLLQGPPAFKTLEKHIPKGLNLKHLGHFMNQTFSSRMNEAKIRAIRDRWKGKLVLKGVASEEDVEKCLAWGVDGIIVSNHGGRQLDAGQSSLMAMREIHAKFQDKITIMMDSGIRSGSDIASVLACGSQFCFLGRTFMYGVGAMGKKGGLQVISILKKQLQQVMEQVSCERVEDLPKHLVGENKKRVQVI